MSEKDLSLQYEQFKPIVEDIENNAVFVGAGVESRVYRANLISGSYAIKIAQKNALNARGRLKNRGLMTESRVNSGIKGLGIYGLEQFVAGSTKDYAAIYKFVDGIRLTSVTDNYVEVVTAEQKERLNQTIIEATEAGLAFDGANPSGANAFYSPTRGFTLIDYSEAYWPITYRENWSAALRSLGPIALQAFANK
jgi:hypothetical protein